MEPLSLFFLSPSSERTRLTKMATLPFVRDDGGIFEHSVKQWLRQDSHVLFTFFFEGRFFLLKCNFCEGC